MDKPGCSSKCSHCDVLHLKNQYLEKENRLLRQNIIDVLSNVEKLLKGSSARLLSELHEMKRDAVEPILDDIPSKKARKEVVQPDDENHSPPPLFSSGSTKGHSDFSHSQNSEKDIIVSSSSHSQKSPVGDIVPGSSQGQKSQQNVIFPDSENPPQAVTFDDRNYNDQIVITSPNTINKKMVKSFIRTRLSRSCNETASMVDPTSGRNEIERPMTAENEVPKSINSPDSYPRNMESLPSSGEVGHRDIKEKKKQLEEEASTSNEEPYQNVLIKEAEEPAEEEEQPTSNGPEVLFNCSHLEEAKNQLKEEASKSIEEPPQNFCVNEMEESAEEEQSTSNGPVEDVFNCSYSGIKSTPTDDFINLTGWVNIKYDKIKKIYLHYNYPHEDSSTGKSLLDLNNFLKSTQFETSHLKRFAFYLDWTNLGGRPGLQNFIQLHGHNITDLSLHGFVLGTTSIDVGMFQKLFIQGMPNMTALHLAMTTVKDKRRTEKVHKHVTLSLKLQLLHLKFLTVQNCSRKFWMIPFILKAAPNLLVYDSKRPVSFSHTKIIKALTEMRKLGTLTSLLLEFHADELNFLVEFCKSEPRLSKIFMQLPKSKDVLTTSLSTAAKTIYFKLLDSNKGTLQEIEVTANTIISDVTFFTHKLQWPQLDNVVFLSLHMLSHQGKFNCQISEEIQKIFPNLKTVEVKLTPVHKLACSLYTCPFLGVSTSVENVRLSEFPADLVKMLRVTFPLAKFVQ